MTGIESGATALRPPVVAGEGVAGHLRQIKAGRVGPA